jgi:hypothetical protein
LIVGGLSWEGESKITGAKERGETVPNQTLDLALTVAYIIDSHEQTNAPGNEKPWANYLKRTWECLKKRHDSLFKKLSKKFVPEENHVVENTKQTDKSPVSILSSPTQNTINIQEKSNSPKSGAITSDGRSSSLPTSSNGENSDVQMVGRASLIASSGDRTLEFDDCLDGDDDDDDDDDIHKYNVPNKEDIYTVAFSTVMKFLNQAIPAGSQPSMLDKHFFFFFIFLFSP